MYSVVSAVYCLGSSGFGAEYVQVAMKCLMNMKMIVMTTSRITTDTDMMTTTTGDDDDWEETGRTSKFVQEDMTERMFCVAW